MLHPATDGHTELAEPLQPITCTLDAHHLKLQFLNNNIIILQN